MTSPEFSRIVQIDAVSDASRALEVQAEEVERINLARRFALISIDRLAARMTLARHDAEIAMEGVLGAAVTQACVATGEPVATLIEAPFDIRFRPHSKAGPEEVELSESELDVIFYDGAAIDIGEAVAETLSLNLDPYPRAPGAAEALKAAGVKSEEEAGPFGVLAGLRDKLKP